MHTGWFMQTLQFVRLEIKHTYYSWWELSYHIQKPMQSSYFMDPTICIEITLHKVIDYDWNSVLKRRKQCQPFSVLKVEKQIVHSIVILMKTKKNLKKKIGSISENNLRIVNVFYEQNNLGQEWIFVFGIKICISNHAYLHLVRGQRIRKNNI